MECFLKTEGGCAIGLSKEVISVFIYAPDQLIRTGKLDVEQLSDLCENIGIYLLAGGGAL